MSYQICTQCKKEKPIEEFAWRLMGEKRLRTCKICHNKYVRGKYQANKEANRARQAARTKELMEQNVPIVNELKSSPCMDCGGSFPPVAMDFDHREATSKKAQVSDMLRSGYSLLTILAEIDKCDLVCANCHRIRTHARLTDWEGARLQNEI